MEAKKITGRMADFSTGQLIPVQLTLLNGLIDQIEPVADQPNLPYLLPGFIDAHVHIESSMLVPAAFARLAVVHGSVATVSDPHEIANVCGIDGVDYMISNGNTVPFKFFFGAPSCVPATQFETAGASLDARDVETLLDRPEICYLSEMMNFPGVLNGDPEVLKKIEAARKRGKPVDGHAPGLRGTEAQQYIDAGISTDHECFTAEEARDKLARGMKILIREGSAARNFDALIDLLAEYPDDIMFCSDDKHPDSLLAGHINQLCARAIARGIPLFNVLKAACVNPVLHYGLPVGLVRVGDPADFILVKDLVNFEVLETYINGQLVASAGKSLLTFTPPGPINRFSCSPVKVSDLALPLPAGSPVPVIEALDGQLITNKILVPPAQNQLPSIRQDILKLVVVNRYHQARPAIALIKNFRLQSGAIASSVAHDSHNIVAVGADDESICRAINLVIAASGGISCILDAEEKILPLPIAGLMSPADGYEVATAYTEIDQLAKRCGSTLAAPFMTLSFMALLVIPHLKLSDKGLFDGDAFKLLDEYKL